MSSSQSKRRSKFSEPGNGKDKPLYSEKRTIKKREENSQEHSTRHRIPCYLAVLGVVISIVLLWLRSYFSAFLLGTYDPLTTSSVVTIHTQFIPLDQEAFSIFIDREESRVSLHGVLSWKTASVSWAWVQCQALASLLPPSGINSSPGDIWRLLPDVNSQEVMYSAKYVAPPPSGPVEELLHDLLSLFHPQPFLYSRYGPQGAVAIVRAKTSDCLDIWFRLHAEYQLNKPPRRPLWFTPATFLGRLVINTTDLTIKHFSLDVPTDKALNVDLEWLIGPNEDKDMEVTITYLPKMSLATEDTNVGDITWLNEITQDEVLARLQKEMYRFMQVDYHNFTDAYLKGSSQDKPVHTIVLWGVLGDQSC